MRKHSLLAGALAFVIAQSVGAETFSSPMTETGWSYSSGTATGSNVRSEKMIMQSSTLIKRNHVYDITFTVGSYSAGAVRPFVGISMPSAPAGSWVLASSVSRVADRFTWQVGHGIETGGQDFTVAPYNLTGPGSSAEDIGSMRVFCNPAWMGVYDPLLLPGTAGGGHLHDGTGNSAVDENTTSTSLRTKGASTCQDARGTDAKYPINASAYWWPTMLDGLGNAIRPTMHLIYYKGPSNPPPVIDYTGNSPFGGRASANGTTTITRTSGVAFSTSAFPISSTIYVGAGTYTVSSITDADHMVLSGTVSTGTNIVYDVFSPTVKSDASFLCNESWGAATLTTDQFGNSVSDTQRCPRLPAQIRFIFGYNKANGQGRPDVAVDTTTGDNGTGAVTSGTQGAIDFSCWAGPDAGTGGAAVQISPNYQTLAALMTAAAANPTYCPLNSVLHLGLGGPQCWDGKYIDSPDHRAHMAYAARSTTHVGNQRCPADHPYRIPQMSLQNFYTIDQAFKDQKWRLSIDEMVDGLPAGAGAHSDYMEGWSDTAENLWFTRCYKPHNSCTQDLGDGTKITDPKSYDGSSQFCNACAKHRPDRYIRVENFGMGWDKKANGTYTVRLKSPGSGVWGFMGLEGFTGTVSSVSIVEVPTGAKGPVTVHN